MNQAKNMQDRLREFFDPTDSFTAVIGTKDTAEVATSLMFHQAVQASRSTARPNCTFIRHAALDKFPLYIENGAKRPDLITLRKIQFLYFAEREDLVQYLADFAATSTAIIPQCLAVDQLNNYSIARLSSEEDTDEDLVPLLALLHDYDRWAKEQPLLPTAIAGNISDDDHDVDNQWIRSTMISLLLEADRIEMYKLYLQLFTDAVFELSTSEQTTVNVNKNGIKLFSCRPTTTCLEISL